jgi:hypothetical protein
LRRLNVTDNIAQLVNVRVNNPKDPLFRAACHLDCAGAHAGRHEEGFE